VIKVLEILVERKKLIKPVDLFLKALLYWDGLRQRCEQRKIRENR
jgi:hypothetical protein